MDNSVKKFDENGKLVKVVFLNDKNEYHREENEPAVIKYNERGNISSKFWYQNGKLHRDGDKPAIIRYSKIQRPKLLEWYQNGNKHRDGDLPAEIYYDNKGYIRSESFMQHGNVHRDGDKPAVIRSGYDNKYGFLIYEYWYQNGKMHRDNHKPADIKKTIYGKIISSRWVVNGNSYEPECTFNELIDNVSDKLQDLTWDDIQKVSKLIDIVKTK